MKNELKQVLNDFIALAKTHYDRKGNEYLLEQLEVALDKLEHNVQDEVALLEKIKKISMSKGWLGGLNSWNTTNTWPGR